MVSNLWTEFRSALADAEHVLVLGHSLHDPALIQAIRNAKPPNLAVTHLNEDGADVLHERDWIEQKLPSAIQIRMDFGPGLEVEIGGLNTFYKRAARLIAPA